ncbi:hypothetical protein M434DRAFT_37153 [Hypoxylon sp. CO27-5]|nr:hypothetical protein M434DRAFT_37153 [Hypoxylon sp. CO27-5]
MSGLAKWMVEPILADDQVGRLETRPRWYVTRLAVEFKHVGLSRAFGSTYTREIDFIEEDWLSRINNNLVKTFVAVPSNDRRRVLSTTSLIGSLPNRDPESNSFQACTEMTSASDQHHNRIEASPLSFQLSSVYTTPEARGKGITKAVVNTAVEEAVVYDKQQNRKLNLSVVVYASNHAAIAFYQSCSFVPDVEGPRTFFNSHKNCYEVELCTYALLQISRMT